MSEFNIEVEGGSSVRLPTGGKYCPKDIIVTAKGGGSAGGGVNIDAILDKSVTEVSSAASGEIVANLFKGCSELKSANFPNVTSLGQNAFQQCFALTSVNFPNATSVGSSAVYYCIALKNANFPNITSVGATTFKYCYVLESIDLPKVTSITTQSFYGCHSLKALILRADTVCSLSGSNTFGECHHILGTVSSQYNPNGDKDGYIYVPSHLVESYKSATNWSTFASQIRAIDEGGGGGGEKLPTPTLMIDWYEGEQELYLSDYGNATSATYYASTLNDDEDSWVEVATRSLTPNSQEMTLQDDVIGWLTAKGFSGSAYLSAITHADGYEDSERAVSNEFMF